MHLAASRNLLLFSVLLFLLTRCNALLSFKSRLPSLYSHSSPGSSRFLQVSASNPSLVNISIDNVNNWYYTQNVTLGTTSATDSMVFSLVFDTGVSYTWLPNSTAINQYFSSGYSCNSSATCSTLNSSITTFNFYQDTISGFLVQEQINIGGYSFSGQDIILATQIGQVFTDQNNYFFTLYQQTFDGYLGLGPNPQANNYTTFLDTLYNSGLISQKWFSFYISNDPISQDSYSNVVFDGYDTTLGSFIYTNSINNTSWMLALNNVTFGGGNITNSTTAIVATGVQFIAIDMQSFTNFWNALVLISDLPCYQSTAQVSNDTASIICTCSGGDLSGYPNFTFYIDNNQMNITPQAYTTYRGYFTADSEEDSETDDDSCMVNIYPNMYAFGINGLEANSGSTWILGTPFLRSYYTIFNESNMTMAFAQLNLESVGGIQPPGSFMGVFELIGGMIIALVIIVLIVRLCKRNMGPRVGEYQPLDEPQVNGQNNQAVNG